MKPRHLLIALSVGVLVVTVAMVGRQRQQLQELRQLAQELQSRTEILTNPPAIEVATTEPAVAVTHSGPSLELLRLRSQVGQLERRKRELAVVPDENKRLQAQLVTKATHGTNSVALPAGYIRKAEAKNAGFGSPEASVHSLLWAIEHRDLPTLLQCFGPEQSKRLAAQMAEQGATSEEFFKDASGLPGLFITGRETKEDGTVELSVQMVPDDDTSRQKLQFQQLGGQWRLISGF